MAADGAKIRKLLKTDTSLISDLVGKATGRLVREVRQTVRAVRCRRRWPRCWVPRRTPMRWNSCGGSY
ncbi:hypothetical protein ACU4GD_08780 [Cupriavidus basilensis]